MPHNPNPKPHLLAILNPPASRHARFGQDPDEQRAVQNNLDGSHDRTYVVNKRTSTVRIIKTERLELEGGTT